MVCNRCDKSLVGNEYQNHWKECSKRRIIEAKYRSIPSDNLSKAKKKIKRTKRKLNQYKIDQRNKNKTTYVDTHWVYGSIKWKRLRYPVLRANNFKCCACNTSSVELHIDHIKPISKYPELAFSINNLQVLCKDCNLSKSNNYEDDLRRKPVI